MAGLGRTASLCSRYECEPCLPGSTHPDLPDEHGIGTDPHARLVVQRPIQDHRLERLGVTRYAQFTPFQKAAVPFSKWEADMKTVYGQAGAAEGRTLKKITWYKNPANASPGIYAAVDFSSQFTELSLHCGFVAMQEQMDGSFGVAREEENSIPKREMPKLSPEALQRICAQYRC